jgi:hypothetical protein
VDVTQLASSRGVAVLGRWMSRETLGSMLAELSR